MFANKRISFCCSLASLVLVTAMLASQAEALPTLASVIACTKDKIVNIIMESVADRSAVVSSYRQAIQTAKQRFEQAKEEGELDNKTENEIENFYLKLAVEEIQNMKQGIGRDIDLGADERVKACIGPDGEHYDPDAMVENWDPDQAMEAEDEIEQDLMARLATIEEEAEMGWSLSPELRETLQERTRYVLSDLINNEARQVALAIVTGFMPGSTIAAGIKFKLVQYLINLVIDVISSALGRRVEITPTGTPVTTPVPSATPAAAVVAAASTVATATTATKAPTKPAKWAKPEAPAMALAA